jgi:hypothetical protein
MAKTLHSALKPATHKSFTLGRKGFAKISAVEGIHLSSKTEAQFKEFDRQELPANKRREEIFRTLGKIL